MSLWPAGLGIAGTGSDACTELYEEAWSDADARIHAITDKFEIPYIFSRCRAVRHGAPPVERTYFNWVGTVNAISFVVGVFFASAGILGLVDRRRAALVTAACVLICFAMVVIFFA